MKRYLLALSLCFSSTLLSAQQLINTSPGSADTAPAAANKINANFTSLWPLLSVPSGTILCNNGALAATPTGCAYLNVHSGALNTATIPNAFENDVYIYGTAGTPTYCNPGVWNICISDAATPTGGNYIGLSVEHAVGAGATGGRIAVQGVLNISGTPTPSSTQGYIAGTFVTNVQTGFGGTSGVYTNYTGGVFGATCNLFGNSSATYITVYNCEEFDVALLGSAAEKHAASYILTNTDTTRATYDDSALEFDNQDSTSNTWKYGIAFGAYAHKWPFGTDSTMIYAWTRQSGSASSSVANIGIDFSNVTFTTDSLKMPGFTVDPSGNIAALSIAPTTYIHGPTTICQSNAALTVGTAAAEYNLASCTIPANAMATNANLEIIVMWSMGANTNVKTATVRYGSTACTPQAACTSGTNYGQTVLTASDASAQTRTLIRENNAASSQVGMPTSTIAAPYVAGSGGSVITSTITTTAATYVNIDCNAATATTDCGIYGYSVVLWTP